jgi:serine/threonine-protein kinase HipA
LKFFNNESIDLPLVEHATMTLAASAGITVAETRPIRLAGEHALAVRRFDRVGGRRIHCLSAGTALRAATEEEPDLSYPALAELLRNGNPTNGQIRRDTAELFRRMVFNILVDNTDDHERNHVLLVFKTEHRVADIPLNYLCLAPAYDLVPTNSGQGLHEFGIGSKGRDGTLVNAMSQCASFGLSSASAAQEVMTVVDVVNEWQSHFAECGVSALDISELASSIDSEELLRQRNTFSAAECAAATARKQT